MKAPIGAVFFWFYQIVETIPDSFILWSLVINAALKYKEVATISLSCISMSGSILSDILRISKSSADISKFRPRHSA